jgi:hypothetical protein
MASTLHSGLCALLADNSFKAFQKPLGQDITLLVDLAHLAAFADLEGLRWPYRSRYIEPVKDWASLIEVFEISDGGTLGSARYPSGRDHTQKGGTLAS